MKSVSRDLKKRGNEDGREIFRGSFLQGWRLREGVYGGYFALCYMLHDVHVHNFQGIKEENKDVRPIQSYLIFVTMAGGVILV